VRKVSGSRSGEKKADRYTRLEETAVTLSGLCKKRREGRTPRERRG